MAHPNNCYYLLICYMDLKDIYHKPLNECLYRGNKEKIKQQITRIILTIHGMIFVKSN